MTRTPIDWTFDGHPIYPPECDLPLPRFCAESTITRAFGFTLYTQTGAVERWAAGDPAGVAEHLDAARERMQSASVPTLAQIHATIGPVVGAEVIGVVKPAPCPECGAAGWHKLICSQRAHDRVTMPAAPDTGG